MYLSTSSVQYVCKSTCFVHRHLQYYTIETRLRLYAVCSIKGLEAAITFRKGLFSTKYTVYSTVPAWLSHIKKCRLKLDDEFSGLSLIGFVCKLVSDPNLFHSTGILDQVQIVHTRADPHPYLVLHGDFLLL